MSDERQYHPAAPAPVAPAEAPLPAPAASSPDALLHLAAIADEVTSAFRHVAAMIPSLQPLGRIAWSIEQRVAALRALLTPPDETH